MLVDGVANISSVFYSHLITVVALHLFHYTAFCISVVGAGVSWVMMLVELINISARYIHVRLFLSAFLDLLFFDPFLVHTTYVTVIVMYKRI